MFTNYLTCFQKLGDFLQNMIDSQSTSEPKKEKQNKGNYTENHKCTLTCIHSKGFDASFNLPHCSFTPPRPDRSY